MEFVKLKHLLFFGLTPAFLLDARVEMIVPSKMEVGIPLAALFAGAREGGALGELAGYDGPVFEAILQH